MLKEDKVTAIVTASSTADHNVIIHLKGKFRHGSDEIITTCCSLFYRDEEELNKILGVITQMNEEIVCYRRRIKDTDAWVFTHFVNPEKKTVIRLFAGYEIY